MNPESKEDLKAASRGVSKDMSSEAISKRFDILVELCELSEALTHAERVEDSPGDHTEDQSDSTE